MYPVSEAFLSAVQENTRRYYWTGKITTKAGVVHEFSEKEIVKGSGYISAQCCDSNEMELGTVYASEMGITLFLDVDRYTLEDAKVELFYHLELEDGSWEEVPMGIFEVSEANRKIKFSGGHADGAKLSAVMSMQIKIGGKQTLQGVGKNPRLARAKSKNDKNIFGLLNQIEENKTAGKIGIHTFTNASAFSISDTDTKIISIEFATSEEVMAQFFGSVIVDVKADPVEKSVTAKTSLVIPAVGVTAVVSETEGEETEESTTDEGTEPEVIGNTKEQTIELEVPVAWKEDGMAVVHFVFELNDVVIDIHQPEETWHSGRHTIMLYYPIDHVIANYRNIFNVYMRMECGTGSVETGNCLAAITGQSMGAGEAWDGEIRIEEKITAFSVGTVTKAVGLNDTVSFKIDETMRRAYADVLTERIKIGAFAMPIETEG